ncbi:MAG: SgcJ/EcaC family oxidoreductase [Phenylobacterium sp.]|uniref:SgcJ/EcaC family oxidoreductase n=1 Tax=Phenylobacterium sp. TaxID=1871053 RepID=UPI002735A390|nr:SgcJ/EcaC family oxidoreductase [Phenylobacterium sp.]MDP3173053.1 SgcJ/EcaC family oxidoreductase [Phenylobacterium sp.]
MTQDIVRAVHAQWAAAFAKSDIEALVALHSTHALFLGSTPALRQGPDGVRAYFKALPPLDRPQAAFSEIVATPLGEDVINLAGIVTFTVGDHPPGRRRLSQVLVREDGVWRIAAHHVSPEN